MRIWIRHYEQILYLDSSKMMRGFLGSGSTTLQNSTVLYVSLQIGCNLIRKRHSEQFFTLCNYSKVLVNSHRKKHRTVHSMSNLNKKTTTHMHIAQRRLTWLLHTKLTTTNWRLLHIFIFQKTLE